MVTIVKERRFRLFLIDINAAISYNHITNDTKDFPMDLTKVTFAYRLLKATDLLIEKCDVLSEIDSRFGDGDHGVTIKRIALAMRAAIEGWDQRSYKQLLDGIGTQLLGIGGGAAGPLWGTLIGGLALPIPENTTEINAVLLKEMFASALEEMESITTARVGDKTMMDVLIPAVQAAQTAGNSVTEVLKAAADAAEQGAKSTENLISRVGRAKNYKEQTLGTPDAGAVSLKTFFEGLASGVE
jgi:phosphoenolpyruvate---glycerone phosphotransferase subunit DhaL